MRLGYCLKHPKGFILNGFCVNVIGPFATWQQADDFYQSDAFPRDRDGETELLAIATID